MRTVTQMIIMMFLLLLQPVHGQFVSSMGGKAGLSIANQSYQFTPIDYTIDTDVILGPGALFFIEAFRKTHFSIQADFAIVHKGSKTTSSSVTVDHLNNDRIIVNEGDLAVSRYNYLSISPMARYRFGSGELNPYLLLGPRLDLLLTYNTDAEYPIDDQNGLIFGLTGGFGVEYNIKKLGLFAEIQYQPDLSTVTSEEPLRVNNNILLIAVGLRYLK